MHAIAKYDTPNFVHVCNVISVCNDVRPVLTGKVHADGNLPRGNSYFLPTPFHRACKQPWEEKSEIVM